MFSVKWWKLGKSGRHAAAAPPLQILAVNESAMLIMMIKIVMVMVILMVMVMVMVKYMII